MNKQNSFKDACEIWTHKPTIMASEEVKLDTGKDRNYSVVYPLKSFKLILLIITADKST